MQIINIHIILTQHAGIETQNIYLRNSHINKRIGYN